MEQSCDTWIRDFAGHPCCLRNISKLLTGCSRWWHEVNNFIPPLNYHRSTWKDGNFLGELPSFHASFLLPPVVQKHSTRFFNGNFTLPFTKEPFVSTCMIMLSPMQTLFAPVSPVRAPPTRRATWWQSGFREMLPTAEIILHVLTPL